MMNNPNINMATLRVACSNCNLRELCLPLGLSLKEIERLEELVSTRKRIKRGEALYRAGDKFEALYAIRLGFLKSAVMSSDGREQVTSFHMSGDIVGLDGLAGMVYSSDLIALEDTEVCLLPYQKLLEVNQSMHAMSLHFQRLLSMEIVRQNGVMLLLGSMHAEERLAAFILNLSQRFEQRGYSRSEFVLRMTRAEIGSYLGLKLETVSRVLSRFSHDNQPKACTDHGFRRSAGHRERPGLPASRQQQRQRCADRSRKAQHQRTFKRRELSSLKNRAPNQDKERA